MGLHDPSQSVGPQNTSPLSMLEAELITAAIGERQEIRGGDSICDVRGREGVALVLVMGNPWVIKP
jgi:hypothetical protein